jgi:group I intron endonuclease
MKERVISCIYKIQSIIKPERIYIGSAVHFYRRRREHLYDLRRGVHNPKLLNHYRKYGEEDLVFSIIAECSRTELMPTNKIIWIEQCFILAYKPWFNASPTAGSCMGTIQSEETRLKIGEKSRVYNTGRHHTEETKRKIGDPQKGKVISAETIKKLEATMFKKGNKPWNYGLKGKYTLSRPRGDKKYPHSIRFETWFRKEELRELDLFIKDVYGEY